MEIQAEIPKIRRGRSRTNSPILLPGHSQTRREESQGVLVVKSVVTERAEGEEHNNHSPSQSKSPKRLLKSVSFQVGQTRRSRHLPAFLKIQEASPSMNKNDDNKTTLNAESESDKKQSITDSNIIQDKTLISRQRRNTIERNKKKEEQSNLAVSSAANDLTQDPEDPVLSDKFAAEVHHMVQKRKFQKVISSLVKMMSNLDELSDEELIELAIQILMKPTSQRTINEIRVLVKCMSAVEFFKKYDKSTTESCLRHMNYVRLKKGEMVFEADTIGTNFWVTLKGSVSVVVKVPTVVGQDEKGENIIEKIPTEVRTLPAGSAFGELALMNSKPRAATIICKEDCEFAVLEKGPFKEILVEKEKKNLFIQLDFLGSVPMLKSVPYHAIHWLYYNMEVTKRTRGQVVSEEGQPFKGIYVVKSGEFKVLKTIEENEEEVPFNDGFGKLKIRQTVKKRVELALLGQKEIFGEDDAMKTNDQKIKYTIVCYSTQAEIFEISKEALEKKILCYSSVRKWLAYHLEGKEAHYSQRLKIIHESRSDPKSGPSYHFDRPRISPLRHNDPTSNSIEYSKRLDNSENEANSHHPKKSMEGLMKLAEKKKAILEICSSPPKIQMNIDRDTQAGKTEGFKKQNGRSNSELKGNPLVMIDHDKIDYNNNKISLMKLNLDRLNAKKRYSRRSVSLEKKGEGSPKKNLKRQSTMKEEDSSINFHNAYNLILNSTIQKLNSTSEAQVKHADSSLEMSSIEESPNKKKPISDKSIFEKVVLKRLGSSNAQHSMANEKLKIHSRAAFENKYAATLYNKTFGKVSWNSKISDNGSTLPLVSQPSVSSKIEENDDTKGYLMARLHSRVHYFSSKRDLEESPVREENASFYSVSQMSAKNHFKGKEVKGTNSRRDLKMIRVLTEGEESPLMINSKSNYTLKDQDRRLRKEL